MSADKLIGITRKELYAIGAPLPWLDSLEAVALAAQKAILATICRKNCSIDEGPFYYLPEGWFRELCAKLGVTE